MECVRAHSQHLLSVAGCSTLLADMAGCSTLLADMAGFSFQLADILQLHGACADAAARRNGRGRGQRSAHDNESRAGEGSCLVEDL